MRFSFTTSVSIPGLLLVSSLAMAHRAAAQSGFSSPSSGEDGAQRPLRIAQNSSTSGVASSEDLVRTTKAGEDAFKAGRFEEALLHFQRAWDARRTHDVAANLGSTELALGRYRDAAEHLTYALRLFPALGAPEAGRRLRVNLADARSHTGALRIRSGNAAGQVKVDARPAAQIPLSDELFVEPGAHQIEISASGYETQTRRLSIAKGESKEIDIAWKPIAAAGAAAGRGTPAALPRSTGAPSSRREEATDPGEPTYVPAYVAAAVSVLAAGAGTVFFVLSHQADQDAAAKRAEIQSTAGFGNACDRATGPISGSCASLHASVNDRKTFQNIATSGFVGAGVALGAALYFAIDPPRSRVEVSPVITQHTAGLVLGGAW